MSHLVFNCLLHSYPNSKTWTHINLHMLFLQQDFNIDVLFHFVLLRDKLSLGHTTITNSSSTSQNPEAIFSAALSVSTPGRLSWAGTSVAGSSPAHGCCWSPPCDWPETNLSPRLGFSPLHTSLQKKEARVSKGTKISGTETSKFITVVSTK